MEDIKKFLINEMLSADGSIAWFRTFYKNPATFYKADKNWCRKFWCPPQEKNTDLYSILKWATEGEFLKYERYFNGYKILLKYSNYYVIDIDKVEGSVVECNSDEILKELYEAYPIFKDYPYTQSRTKRYPHIYIPITNLPSYSHQVDVLKIKTKNLTLYGDLLKETGTVEQQIIYNYDENKKVCPLDWNLICDLFDTNKMNIQYQVEVDDEKKTEIRLLHKKTVDYEDKRQDFELRGKFIDRILDEIIKKDKSFFGSRDNWMRLTFLIQYELGEKGKEIWDYHCSRVPNYNYYENMNFWNKNIDKNTDNPVTLGTLYKWATDLKIDVKEIRKQIYIKTYIDLSDMELATMYAEEIKDFIKFDENTNKFYMYDDDIKLWTVEDKCLKAMAYLEPYLKPILKSYLDGIVEETDKAKKQKKNIEKCMGKIGTIKFQKTLWEKVSLLIKDNEFSKKLNTNPNLLAISNNEVLDLSSGMTFERTKEHYFSKLVPRRYDEYMDTSEFEAYMKTLLVDKSGKTDYEYMNYFQMLFGYFLTGKTNHRKYYVFLGEGANGKTTFFNLYTEMFKGWVKSASEAVVLKELDSSVNTPEMRDLFDCRVSIIEEVPSTKQLNTNRLKLITGTSPITGKELYATNTYTEYTQSKLCMIQNKMPKIDLTSDDAVADRLVALPWNARFIFDRNSRSEKIRYLQSRYKKQGIEENKIQSKVETEMKRLEELQKFLSDQEIEELRRKQNELIEKIKNPSDDMLDQAFNWFVKGAIRSYKEGFDHNYKEPKICRELKGDIADSNDYLKDYIEEYYDEIDQSSFNELWKKSGNNKSKFITYKEFNNGYKTYLRENGNPKFSKQDIDKQYSNYLGNEICREYNKYKYMNKIIPKPSQTDDNDLLSEE